MEPLEDGAFVRPGVTRRRELLAMQEAGEPCVGEAEALGPLLQQAKAARSPEILRHASVLDRGAAGDESEVRGYRMPRTPGLELAAQRGDVRQGEAVEVARVRG